MLEAFVVTDAADVTEVVRWAEESSDGRRVEIFAEMDHEPVRRGVPRRAGLVRLMGSNPNEGVSVEIGRFVKIEDGEESAEAGGHPE